MIGLKKSNIDIAEYNNSELECRWTTLSAYRLILWAWMMSELSIMFSPVDISHSGFYIQALLHAIAIIFIGIPLVYSEICISQYTNCNVLTMWDYFPLLRSAGYGSIFLVVLKTMYITVCASWYLEYTFFAAFDPPPWFTCDEFKEEKCMVKRVNVSIFQHCLETEVLFGEDCGMKTASNCFYQREIGNNTTNIWPSCIHPWKQIIACGSITLTIFILSMKNEKYLQLTIKLVAIYVSMVMFILFCIAFSMSGTWYATKIIPNWSNYNVSNCLTCITRGFLSLGTGYGIIIYISRDVPFRSPANMTSVITTLLTIFVTLIYSLIIFSGIKTMSYFHGEEENVMEIGEDVFFTKFASVSEIMSYFDALPLWGFTWFSSVFLFLFVNLWILHLYLRDLLLENCNFARRRKNFCSFILTFSISLTSIAFFCADLSPALSDATAVIQTISTFFFSITLYWIYGYENHITDIIFMIGVKATYFWKISWLLSPIYLPILLYTKLTNLDVNENVDSYFVTIISIPTNLLLFYIFVGIYLSIVVLGILITTFHYYRHYKLMYMVVPLSSWGPKDKIFLKSRAMFVPQIMTREFLYRQVRIHGYKKKRTQKTKIESSEQTEDVPLEKTEWSVLTSN